MKCATCGGEMIQKSRRRLVVVGILMLTCGAGAFFVPYFRAPAVVLGFTALYLLVWATLGKGRWCRTCKRFGAG
jgi:uncharacterized membrane protein HdeD (DUF308 family)